MTALDLQQVNLRRGVVGTAGILVTVAFIGVFGPAGFLAGLCALFLGVLDEPDPVRERLVLRGRFVLVGALVVGLLSWSGDHTWSATVVAAVITYVATLLAAWGPSAAAQGQFIVLLTVITLMVGPTDLSPLELAASFAAGGVIATAVSLVGGRWAGDDSQPADTTAADPPTPGPDAPPSVAEAVHSEVGVFALVRALAVALATAAGYELFEQHPVWAVLTVVIVVQTPARQTLSVGVERTLGTVAGVVVGMLVAQWLGSNTAALVIAVLVTGFAMMTFKDVSYVLTTSLTTCLLLFSQAILQEDTFSTGWQRLGATLLGTGIALAIVYAFVLRDRSNTD